MLLNLNSIFHTCTVEGWKRFQSFSSFPRGRAKPRYENDRVDAILSLRFQWNKNANFWKRIRVDGALDGPTCCYSDSCLFKKVTPPSPPSEFLHSVFYLYSRFVSYCECRISSWYIYFDRLRNLQMNAIECIIQSLTHPLTHTPCWCMPSNIC